MDTDQTTVLDVNQSVWDFFLKRHPLMFIFLVVLPVLVSIGIGYLEFTYGGSSVLQTKSSTEGALFIALLPLLVSFGTFSIVHSRIEKTFYTQLASALNCSYSSIAPKPTSGQLSHMGTYAVFRNVLSGTYANFSFQLGDFIYTTGSGKSREDHPFTLGVVTLHATLPHIMCVPRNWTNIVFNIWKPSGTHDLSLEGNFNTTFTVYVPEGSEIEALQVLEPNVMEKLMEGFEGFGFECIDSSLYLCTPGSMRENRESVLHMYTLLQRFCDVLAPEFQTFTHTTGEEQLGV